MFHKFSDTAQGMLWMLLSTAVLASMHAIVRHVATDMHPFEIAFFRNLFGFAAILPMLVRNGRSSLHTKQPKLQILRGVTGILAMLTWFFALSVVPIATATALSFTAAVFASLGALIFLGEKMRLRRWMAVIVSFIGVLIILRPGTGGFNVEALTVLFSASMWGAGVVIVKQLSRTDTGVAIVGWMGITLTILSIPPALFVWVSPTPTQLAWLCLIGLLGTVGHLTMIRGLRQAETTAVMSVDFARLLWATLLGSFFFADPVDALTWIGGGVIFASGIYIIYRESRVKAGA
jgi:drug/metabolite transporter (DMT)-like permease